MPTRSTRVLLTLGCVFGSLLATVAIGACSGDDPAPKRTNYYANETGRRPCPRTSVDAGGNNTDGGGPFDAGPSGIDGGRADGGAKDGGAADGGADASASLPDAGTVSPSSDCDDAGSGDSIFGIINAIQGERTPGDTSTTYRRIEAGFEVGSRRDCTTYPHDSCTAIVCTDTIDAGPPRINDKVPNVGRIDINGPVGSETLLPLDNGSYPTVDKLANPLWGGSGFVRFVAVGSTSASALDTSVVIPSKVELVSPALGSGTNPLPVNRNSVLPVTWNPVAIETSLEIVIRSSDDKARLECTRSSSVPQSFEVPIAALRRLPEGEATLAIYSKSEQTLARSDSMVRVAAKTPALQGNKLAVRNIVLQ